MNALRLIRNPRAVVKLAPKRWPKNLPPPLFADDTRNKSLAVSALRGFAMRDSEPLHACDLTTSQARDVAVWLRLSRPSTPSPVAPLSAAGADGLSFFEVSP